MIAKKRPKSRNKHKWAKWIVSKSRKKLLLDTSYIPWIPTDRKTGTGGYPPFSCPYSTDVLEAH